MGYVTAESSCEPEFNSRIGHHVTELTYAYISHDGNSCLIGLPRHVHAETPNISDRSNSQLTHLIPA